MAKDSLENRGVDIGIRKGIVLKPISNAFSNLHKTDNFIVIKNVI